MVGIIIDYVFMKTQLILLKRAIHIGAPIFIALFLKYKQCFYENIINNDTNHNNYDATMCQSYLVPTLTVLVKKYRPCQGMV